MKTAATFIHAHHSLLAAMQHLDIFININHLTLPINNTTLLMITIIRTLSIMEQFVDTTTRITISIRGSSIVMTMEDMMNKATMNKKETTAKLIMLAMKDKLSIAIDSLINTMMTLMTLLHKDSGIDDILESESEVSYLRNNIE